MKLKKFIIINIFIIMFANNCMDQAGPISQSSLADESMQKAFPEINQQRIQTFPIVLHKEIGQYVIPRKIYASKYVKQLIPLVIASEAIIKYSSVYPKKTVRDFVINAEKELKERFSFQEKLASRHHNQNLYIIGIYTFNFDISDKENKVEPIRKVLGFIKAKADQNLAMKIINEPISDNSFQAIMYSNGEIKWRISKGNKLILLQLSEDEIQLAIDLFNNPKKHLTNEQRLVFESLPKTLQMNLKLNYDIKI